MKPVLELKSDCSQALDFLNEVESLYNKDPALVSSELLDALLDGPLDISPLTRRKTRRTSQTPPSLTSARSLHWLDPGVSFPRSQTLALLPGVDFRWSGANLEGGFVGGG